MNHNIFLVLAVICFGIVGYLFFFKPYPELIQNPEIMEEQQLANQEEFENQAEEFGEDLTFEESSMEEMENMVIYWGIDILNEDRYQPKFNESIKLCACVCDES